MPERIEIDIVILSAFLQGPAHGYELKQRIDISFGQFYMRASTGSIYTRLAKFEELGYIEGWREQQEKFPDRKVYQITDAGRKRLVQLIATPVQVTSQTWPELSHMVVHAVLFGLIPKEQRVPIVTPFLEAYRQQLVVGREAQKKYGPRMDKFMNYTMDWGLKAAEENIKYFEALLALD